ncbi:hypothetical protein MMC07_002594 [Pseudocyphellaria aurata]|nr:hypothetical protein [Pseudocyphellaria aurata]
MVVYGGLPSAAALQSSAEIPTGPVHSTYNNNFAFSPDASLVLVCHHDAVVYAADSCKPVFAAECEKRYRGWCLGTAWSPKGDLLAVLLGDEGADSDDSDVGLDGAYYSCVETHAHVVIFNTLDWTVAQRFVDSSCLVARKNDGDPFVCNFYWSPCTLVNCLSFIAIEGLQMLFPDTDKWVSVDLEEPASPGPQLPQCGCACSPDGWALALIVADISEVAIVNLTEPAEVNRLKPCLPPTASARYTACVPQHELNGTRRKFMSRIFSGPVMALGCWRLWSVPLGPHRCNWSPDGWALAAADNSEVILVDLMEAAERSRLDACLRPAAAAAAAAEDAACSQETGREVMDTDAGTSAGWHQACVTHVQWTSDGARLFAFLEDAPVRVTMFPFQKDGD